MVDGKSSILNMYNKI